MQTYKGKPREVKKTSRISDNKSKKKRTLPSPGGGPKWAAPLGFAVLLLALVGVLSIAYFTYSGIKRSAEENLAQRKAYYEQMLAPVVMADSKPFSSIDRADSLFLLKVSIFSILNDESVELPYDDYGYMMLSTDLISAECKDLFGEKAECKSESFFANDVYFDYSYDDDSFHFPATGHIGEYRPFIESVESKKGETIITVGYIMSESGSDDVVKKMVYKLSGKQDSEYIISIEAE